MKAGFRVRRLSFVRHGRKSGETGQAKRWLSGLKAGFGERRSGARCIQVSDAGARAHPDTEPGADHAVGDVLVVGPAIADPCGAVADHDAGDVGAQELVHQRFGVAASGRCGIGAAVVAHEDAAAFDFDLVA